MAAMLGEIVVRLRKERDWTQIELAEASGVSQGAISAIENGRKTKVRIETVEKLARALGVPVGYLLQAEEDQSVQPAAVQALAESRASYEVNTDNDDWRDILARLTPEQRSAVWEVARQMAGAAPRVVG